MNGWLALVFLACILARSLSFSNPQLERKESRFLSDCARRENVSVDGISEYLLKRHDVEYKTMCALSCYFRVSPGIQFALREFKKEYGEDSCNSIKGGDKCEKGFKQIECYLNKYL